MRRLRPILRRPRVTRHLQHNRPVLHLATRHFTGTDSMGIAGAPAGLGDGIDWGAIINAAGTLAKSGADTYATVEKAKQGATPDAAPAGRSAPAGGAGAAGGGAAAPSKTFSYAVYGLAALGIGFVLMRALGGGGRSASPFAFMSPAPSSCRR